MDAPTKNTLSKLTATELSSNPVEAESSSKPVETEQLAGTPGDSITFGDCTATIVKSWVSPKNRPLYVGLSGGMGAGKSTLADVWAKLGAHVISADDLAREMLLPNSAGLELVVKRFGYGVILPDGSLHRSELGRIVFESASERRALEKITHPLIAERAKELRMAAAPDQVVVYDVPLLVENQMAGEFDCVVMVHAPSKLRLERLEGRGIPAEIAKPRIAAQAAMEERRVVSNIWVENLGSPSEMSEVASRVFTAWLKEK